MAKNEVRIISGKWRGRKLRVANRPGLRPSLGRTRETLFNWLIADLPDASVVDLFAGSGCLGFEAESRGAAKVTLVDSDRLVAAALRQAASQLGSCARIHHSSAERFLTASEPADIWLLDPPFDGALLAPALESLRTRQLATGLVYVERRASSEPFGEGWRTIKHSKAGESEFALLAAV
ncbi:MAG: 16S rRNA (guanine(966)-N(2))-methyltransferase RsmD [Pseudomonadaceae bacterium]|nr:16S rRNA (guanine(966)-N(2))-methyltransferase RsmD [Pseudomonadaceae bacterium]